MYEKCIFFYYRKKFICVCHLLHFNRSDNTTRRTESGLFYSKTITSTVISNTRILKHLSVLESHSGHTSYVVNGMRCIKLFAKKSICFCVKTTFAIIQCTRKYVCYELQIDD